MIITPGKEQIDNVMLDAKCSIEFLIQYNNEVGKTFRALDELTKFIKDKMSGLYHHSTYSEMLNDDFPKWS